MRGTLLILMLLVAGGCIERPQAERPPSDIVPLPENPGAEIKFLQSRDLVTGIRARLESEIGLTFRRTA